jgi:hypothetical protein
MTAPKYLAALPAQQAGRNAVTRSPTRDSARHLEAIEGVLGEKRAEA